MIPATTGCDGAHRRIHWFLWRCEPFQGILWTNVCLPQRAARKGRALIYPHCYDTKRISEADSHNLGSSGTPGLVRIRVLEHSPIRIGCNGGRNSGNQAAPSRMLATLGMVLVNRSYFCTAFTVSLCTVCCRPNQPDVYHGFFNPASDINTATSDARIPALLPTPESNTRSRLGRIQGSVNQRL